MPTLRNGYNAPSGASQRLYGAAFVQCIVMVQILCISARPFAQSVARQRPWNARTPFVKVAVSILMIYYYVVLTLIICLKHPCNVCFITLNGASSRKRSAQVSCQVSLASQTRPREGYVGQKHPLWPSQGREHMTYRCSLQD